MKHPCAISLCSVDLDVAGKLQGHLARRGVGTFFYNQTPLDQGFMFNQHADVYAQAIVRIYLLREQSFRQVYPSFELDCGRDQPRNLVVPVEPDVHLKVPNSHLYMFNPGWDWLPLSDNIDMDFIIGKALTYLRAAP